MARWTITVDHPELGKSRVITGNDKTAVELKAAEQKIAWNTEWNVVVWNSELKKTQEALETLLAKTIAEPPSLDWPSLKIAEDFPEAKPNQPVHVVPPEPKRSRFDAPFSQQTSFERCVHALRKLSSNDKFLRRHNAWEDAKRQADAEKCEFEKALADWEGQRTEHLAPIRRFNAYVKEWNEKFEAGRRDYLGLGGAPILYLSSILVFDALTWQRPRVTKTSNELEDVIRRVPSSLLGDIVAKLKWKAEAAILLVDFDLPKRESFPEMKSARYIKAGNKADFINLKPGEFDSAYNNLLYEICLRTIYLLYKFDDRNVVKSIVFNGWAEFVNPATGLEQKACIMTVQADRDTFLSLQLNRVDPMACFRKLKGISAPRLHEMIPVIPILRQETDDSRFVESRAIAGQLREGTNIAAIGWEDFEHLIRELFEREFSRCGGQVKVTQASRDGGVDAIAFDPDPIRGGKIVIQAKRYTNTVDVSSVRDLWGTIQHEGAMKGILVTTSSFGADSYVFAKDKPITLLDGSNLLHMLERNGQPAYSDLTEAKKLNPQRLARTIQQR